MILEINEEQARAILDAVGFCESEGMRTRDTDFVYPLFIEAFPVLKSEFSYLETQ